jgi:hypothetical protein
MSSMLTSSVKRMMQQLQLLLKTVTMVVKLADLEQLVE